MSDGKIVDLGGKPLGGPKELVLPGGAHRVPDEGTEEAVKLPREVMEMIREHGGMNEARAAASERITDMVERMEHLCVKRIDLLPIEDQDKQAVLTYVMGGIVDWAHAAGVPGTLLSHFAAMIETLSQMQPTGNQEAADE